MRLKLKNVRIAFPDLFEPKGMSGDASSKPTYGATFLLPPDHPQMAEIHEAIRGAAIAKWDTKAEANLRAIKAGGKTALHNGDEKPQYQGYEGNMYLSARNKAQPLVVGLNGKTIDQRSGIIYSGCYVNASLELWAQDNAFGKRVNATLLGVQFLRDGDAFAAGSVASEDEFEDLSDGADAADLF